MTTAEIKTRRRAAIWRLWTLIIVVLVTGCANREPLTIPTDTPKAEGVSAAAFRSPESAAAPDSREYKILLTTERFADRSSGADSFWDLVKSKAEGRSLTVKDKEPAEKSRHVWFLDTRDLDLRGTQGLVFRERQNLKDNGKPKKSKKVTLKYRGPDRVLAAQLNLKAEAGKDIEQKLEEDIGLNSLDEGIVKRKLSKSGSTKLPKNQSFATIDDIAILFPGVDGFVTNIRDKPVIVVNDFVAYEVKRKAGAISLTEDCDADASFTFWHHTDLEGPLEIAEFSFDYKLEPNCSDAKTDATATSLLIALGKSEGWPDPHQRTKTQVAYER